MPTEETKRLIEQARAEALANVTNARVALLRALDELEDVGGKDDYKTSLHGAIEAFPDGLQLSKARLVFHEIVKLTGARKALEDAALIQQSTAGASITMKAVKAERAADLEETKTVAEEARVLARAPEAAAAAK